jgi:hypothetical protein
VQEKMLHGEGNEAERDMTAEHAAKVFEVFDDDGLVQRPALGASQERYDSAADDWDGVGTVVGLQAKAEVDRFGRHLGPRMEKTRA